MMTRAPLFLGNQCSCSSCPTASYNKHVRLVMDFIQIDLVRIHSAPGLEDVRDFLGHRIAFARSYFYFPKGARPKVRVVFFQSVFSTFKSESGEFLTGLFASYSVSPSFLHSFNKIHQFLGISHLSPPVLGLLGPTSRNDPYFLRDGSWHHPGGNVSSSRGNVCHPVPTFHRRYVVPSAVPRTVFSGYRGPWP